MNAKYQIQTTQSGDLIEVMDTLSEAVAKIAEYCKEDETTPGAEEFYEINRDGILFDELGNEK